ncbi:hypothetical protein N7494_011716 [Penicillium frequentans]|uniref:F-box domain-containing protein n=1 Tax=Penicillium frequentans TaxID=3151616 RepID=A0AAD6G9F3_9EURO|nr:hypothetical protein N7494_011716 [Penicillium glabrum]
MSIASLPVELISKICNHLDIQQWAALRLSCRAFYENSLEKFAETYYKSIRFIVTSESLHELEKISKSNGLREHVQELWMIPTVFSGTEHPIGMVSISSESCRQVKGDELDTRHIVHKAMIADNSNLLESGTFSVRLRECMNRFQNLQTIGLAHYSTEFLLDPRQKTVPFLGRRQMMSQLDFRFDVHSLQSLTQTNTNSQIRNLNSLALSKLFLALCGSKCKPRKLYTCDSNFCGDIGPKIALSEEQFDSLLSALKSLEDLHLCIDLNEAAWLKLITNLAPQLEKLTLSQDHLPRYLTQEEMPPYPAKSYAGNMFQGITFTRLRELHIHKLDIYFNSLKSLLLSVKKSLVILTLERVTLRSEESRAAEDFASQHRKSPNHQENQSSSPPTYTPGSPGFVPTSPGFHPTSPSYTPTSPYVPTSPSIQPTLPLYTPTFPSFQPTSPSYTPASPAAEPELPESAPPSPQHSSISSSSEPMTNEYLIANWSSIYHPYSPPGFAGSVCPAYQTLRAWTRNEQMVTCVSSLLDTLQNELSLEVLSLEDIICDGNYYYFKRVNDGIQRKGRVDFDIHSAGTLLREWVSDLRPEPSCPGYRVLDLNEHGG